MSVALVLGGAACLWADIEAALELGEYDGTVACNDAGVEWPGPLDAWVSLHADKFKPWTVMRERNGFEAPKAIYGHEERVGRFPRVTHTTQWRFPDQKHTGSSGLFALKVALIDLGFDKAVLCGVPLKNDQAHFFDTKDWRAAASYRTGWLEAKPHIITRARSMSGFTAELIGRPDEEWLSA